jgi:hypothetical protein
MLGLAACASAALAADAEESKQPAPSGDWQISVSPYTEHFRHSNEHKPVWAVGLERGFADQSLYGLMGFSNSFGQPSAYVYYGWAFPGVLQAAPALYLKVTVGLLYGYVSPHNDKVPLNYNGLSPAIVPALGWQFDKNWSAQVNLLGTAAVMFMVNRKL